MWKKSVGSGHAALWSRADWRAHLKVVAEECGFQMVRGHGILDNQVMYYDGAEPNGKSDNQSSFFDAFSAFDYMLSVNVKPLVELSFTPDPLVTKWVPGLPVPAECNHFHYEGCELFPNNLTKYTAYIHAFAEALVQRYGLAEVSQWYFEVYNEADMHWPFLHYGQMYAAAAEGIKSVDTSLRVGGPVQSKIRVPLFAVRALNVTGQCRVTLSLR